MDIARHLEKLARPAIDERRRALEEILTSEGLSFTVQDNAGDGEKSPLILNYLILPEAESPCPLFSAHYDAYPGSPGANDNAAAVCILIDLALTLRARGLSAAFAFFDGEENGHTGAKLFEKERRREFSVIVNLDMCGYGDTIAVYAKGGERKPAARAFCNKKLLRKHSGRMVRFIPEGDETAFHSMRQPVLSMAVMPLWDTKYLDAVAAHGGGLFGRPPEIRMMISDMEVSSTMHGGFRDQVKWVQPDAMRQAYDYLLDALGEG